MASRDILQTWLIEALAAHDGEATVLEVTKHIWAHHEVDLRDAGDLFFTWQYDVRWAATKLRKKGLVGPANPQRQGVWTLA